MKINIPAQVILKCDRCGAEGKDGEGAFQYGGASGKMQIWSRDYMGNAGGITIDLELCSYCSCEFEKFLSNNKKTDGVGNGK